jgi:hypothetical protein
MIQKQGLSLKSGRKAYARYRPYFYGQPWIRITVLHQVDITWRGNNIPTLVLPREGAYPRDNKRGIPSPEICVFLYWDASTHVIPSNNTCKGKSYRTSRLLLLPLPRPS